ncbi:hypothetical protein HK405_011517, partial [Cladochytrium tenue]
MSPTIAASVGVAAAGHKSTWLTHSANESEGPALSADEDPTASPGTSPTRPPAATFDSASPLPTAVLVPRDVTSTGEHDALARGGGASVAYALVEPGQRPSLDQVYIKTRFGEMSLNDTAANATSAALAPGATIDAGTLGAYVGIALMAVAPIYVGAYGSLPRSYSKKKKGRRGRRGAGDSDAESDADDDEDEGEFFSFDDAKWYPVVGSAMLLSLYLVIKYVSKDVINMVLTVNFVGVGLAAVYRVLIGVARGFGRGSISSRFHLSFKDKKTEIFGIKFGWTHIVVGAIASAMIAVYAVTKHWILSNIIGESLSIVAIQLLNLDSFATGMLLLTGLFFYDVFWVFGTEVMVTVAKGLDVPIKVVFPRDLAGIISQGFWNKPAGIHFSMLGLGDIVIPGIFVALCLNYDYHRYKQSARGQRKNSRFFPAPYFTTCFIMYILGLALTFVIMHTFQAAQPALLYLSPACILSALGVATIKGELKDLFDYAPNGSPASESKKQKEEEAAAAAASAAATAKTDRNAESTPETSAPSPLDSAKSLRVRPPKKSK